MQVLVSNLPRGTLKVRHRLLEGLTGLVVVGHFGEAPAAEDRRYMIQDRAHERSDRKIASVLMAGIEFTQQRDELRQVEIGTVERGKLVQTLRINIRATGRSELHGLHADGDAGLPVLQVSDGSVHQAEHQLPPRLDTVAAEIRVQLVQGNDEVVVVFGLELKKRDDLVGPTQGARLVTE